MTEQDDTAMWRAGNAEPEIRRVRPAVTGAILASDILEALPGECRQVILLASTPGEGQRLLDEGAAVVDALEDSIAKAREKLATIRRIAAKAAKLNAAPADVRRFAIAIIDSTLNEAEGSAS